MTERHPFGLAEFTNWLNKHSYGDGVPQPIIRPKNTAHPVSLPI